MGYVTHGPSRAVLHHHGFGTSPTRPGDLGLRHDVARHRARARSRWRELMSWMHGLRHRLRAIFHPGAFEREMQEEMQFHLELESMQMGDTGAARRRFGNRTYYQEETR